MAGDPAIRWQVMRDLHDTPEPEWQAERGQLLERGWATNLLARQNAESGWGDGVYSPKWISSTYTLSGLREMDLPGDCEQAQRGAKVMIGRMLGETSNATFLCRLANCDRCIVGMIMEISVYFWIKD